MTTLFTIDPEPTEVFTSDRSFQIESGSLWPVPIRGSKYMIRFSDHSVEYSPDTDEPEVIQNGEARRIGMNRLKEFSPGPEVSEDTITLIEGIRGWKNGPVTITPRGEALVWSEDKNGWNPYYVGIVNVDPIWFQHPDCLGHPGVNGLFPTPESSGCGWFTPGQWSLWTGCMFKTGEPWTVRKRAREFSELTWPGRLSSYLRRGLIILGTGPNHKELIDAYFELRPCGGRLYVLMGGHIWMNLRKSDIENTTMDSDEVWRKLSKNTLGALRKLTSSENHPLTQMFNARMLATKGDRSIDEACLPIYLGNCADFDDGAIPVTKVSARYKRAIRRPDMIEGDEQNPYSDRKEREE